MSIYLGIDPGVSGGLAALTETGHVVMAVKMPETVADICLLIKAALADRAAVEHVWSTPGQGGAFAFGKNVGFVLMGLTAAGVPFDQVLPRTWQKALGVSYPKGATDTQKKNITKGRAQQLFPAVKMNHSIADCLLIAEWARRQELGMRHDAAVEAGRQVIRKRRKMLERLSQQEVAE